MIIREMYEFDYELFLAEQELYESLIDYGAIVATESYGLFLLNEGVKETILKYLERVGASIGKVWGSFKNTLENTKDKAYLKLIESKINDADPKFTISNFPTYNIARLNEIKTEQLNFEEMKDDLVSKEAFISKHYPNIRLDDKNKSFKDAIRSYCLTKREDTRCTKELLKSMYKFCSNDYNESMRSIQDDLKKYNTSAKNIQNLVNQVTSAETTQNECVSVFESYLYEAENDQNNTKVEYKDDPDAKQKGQGNNDITKKITVFVQITTDILSAKLSIVKEIYQLYMNTLHHYIKPSDVKDDNDQKKIESNNNSNANNGSVEVEI